MNITITGRHVSVSDELKGHIQARVERFARYFDHIIDVHVTLSAEKYRHGAEVSVFGKNLRITEKQEAGDSLAALDSVCSRLEVALRRRKDKLKVYRKKNPPAAQRTRRDEEV